MSPRVAIVGLGGLGCPAAHVLAQQGVHLRVIDDDRVDESNLQRQILFSEEDVGEPKVLAGARRLRELGAKVEARQARLTPETIDGLLDGADLIIDGVDNLPTKFLLSDYARDRLPVVHGGAVRWKGWALRALPAEDGHHACLRCLFEDVPDGPAADCEFAGIASPVVGAIGALQARLALGALAGDARAGMLFHLDGLRPMLRQRRLEARAGCTPNHTFFHQASP